MRATAKKHPVPIPSLYFQYDDIMAKSRKVNYSEADLIDLFALEPIAQYQTPEMQRWLAVHPPILDVVEAGTFDRILPLAIKYIRSWGEEDLKMHFISAILPLGHLVPNGRYNTFYEKTISAQVGDVELSTKTDFMVATGILNKPKVPYFHFQEYKPSKPTGDSMAQLLEAMLIAQAKNNNQKPIYGCEIIAETWRFIILKDKSYCISKPYISTERDDLLSIIAILRHFKHILETELLDDI